MMIDELKETQETDKACSQNEITVSELIRLLSKFDNTDKVTLRIWGMSDCPSANLSVNGQVIMTDEY